MALRLATYALYDYSMHASSVRRVLDTSLWLVARARADLAADMEMQSENSLVESTYQGSEIQE